MKIARGSIITRSAAETQAAGRRLARLFRRGDVAVLLANLGAGKTTLVQGIAAGLRVKDGALSPTFVIAQTLPGRIPIHHMDFYRLSKREILGIGVEDYLNGSGDIERGLVLIEWAERCRELWPAERLEIRLRILPRSRSRRLSLVGRGDRFAALVKRFLSKKS